MATALSSYFFSPASAGTSAVNTCPQPLQRSCSSSYAVASRRSPCDSDQRFGVLLAVHFAFLAFRARIARLERGMRDGDSLRTGEPSGAVAPVSRLGRFALRRRLFPGSVVWVLMREHGVGFFRGSPSGGCLFRQRRHCGFDL